MRVLSRSKKAAARAMRPSVLAAGRLLGMRYGGGESRVEICPTSPRRAALSPARSQPPPRARHGTRKQFGCARGGAQLPRPAVRSVPVDLDDHRVALPAAGADRGNAKPAAAAAELVDKRRQDTGATCADRVTEGDRAAVDVHLALVDAQ